MTHFYRSGYWRYSKYGNRHWVEGHSVDRDDWYRSSSLFQKSTVPLPVSFRYVNPNAVCPVCGAEVYFYQNEHGSRVYFDELGPPWPKHPCTDSDVPRSRKRRHEVERPEPYLYPESLTAADIRRFKTKTGIAPADPYILRGTFRIRFQTLLALDGVRRQRRLFLSIKRLPRGLRLGSMIFRKRGEYSYFDEAALRPKFIDVVKLPNQASFVELLIDDQR